VFDFNEKSGSFGSCLCYLLFSYVIHQIWTFYLSLLERSSCAVSEVRFYFPWPDLVFTAAVFPVILSFPARAMVLLVSSPAQQLFCTGFWAAAILSVWLFPDSPD
jgi:hypothetical protein